MNFIVGLESFPELCGIRSALDLPLNFWSRGQLHECKAVARCCCVVQGCITQGCCRRLLQELIAKFLASQPLHKAVARGCCRLLHEAVAGCCTRLLHKAVARGCCTRLLQGCCRLLHKAGAEGCCTRLLHKAVAQGCCTRLLHGCCTRLCCAAHGRLAGWLTAGPSTAAQTPGGSPPTAAGRWSRQT
jgi:hypothetical protein